MKTCSSGLHIRAHSLARDGASTHECDVGDILDKCDGFFGVELAVTILFRAAQGSEYRLEMLCLRLRCHPPVKTDSVF